MVKKIMSLLLVFIVCISALGCGGSKNNVKSFDEARSVFVIGEENANAKFDDFDVVKFGEYPQSDKNGSKKEPIYWFVLSKHEDKREIELISKYILDVKAYHNGGKLPTYTAEKNSSLFKWLNSEFKDVAFSDDEKNLIVDEIKTPMYTDLKIRPKVIQNGIATNYAKREIKGSFMGKEEAKTITVDNGNSPYWLYGYLNANTKTAQVMYTDLVVGEWPYSEADGGVRPVIVVKY